MLTRMYYNPALNHNNASAHLQDGLTPLCMMARRGHKCIEALLAHPRVDPSLCNRVSDRGHRTAGDEYITTCQWLHQVMHCTRVRCRVRPPSPCLTAQVDPSALGSALPPRRSRAHPHR